MLVKIKGRVKDLTVEEIYQEMYPFMIKRCKKWNGTELENEENLSIAKIAFMRTIKKYKHFKGAFITLLAFNIDSEFYKYITRDKDKSVKASSLDIAIGERDKDKIIEFIEDINSSEEILNVEKRLLINDMINSLNYEDKELIKMYYYQDKNQVQISHVLNVSQPTVGRRLKVINAKLKDVYKEAI